MNGSRSDLHRSGLTALELLVALAVAAVIAGIAVPALQNAALNARRLSAVNGFIAAIQFARSAAQTRNATVFFCRAGAAPPCGGGSDPAADKRWMVAVADEDAPSSSVANARVLRVLDTRFPGTITSNRLLFEFRPFPKRSTNGTLAFCDPRGGRSARAVVVSTAGRPRVVYPESDQGLSACAPP